MVGSHDDMVALLLLVAGSFFMPLAAARIRFPSAVLLIGYGSIVGPHGLGLVRETGVVPFLAELGFITLMFLAGLEIDFNEMRQRGRRALLGIVSFCLVVVGLSFAAAWWAGLHPVYGLALGATSVGLPLAVLKETGRLRSALGQSVIVVGSVGEFLTVILMTLFYFAFHYGFSLDVLWALAKLLAMLALSGLTLRTLTAFAWWHPDRFSRLVDRHDASEFGVRATVLLMVAFSVLALLTGLEMVLGSFVAGAMVAFVLRGKKVLEEKLAVVGHGLFVPLFFVVVGMRFEAQGVTVAELRLAGELLVALLAVRLIPGLVMLRGGLRVGDRGRAALLLSAPLTLVVAIAALGVEIGALAPSGRKSLVLLAILSGVIFPVCFRLLAGRAEPAADPGREAPVAKGG